MTKYKNLPASVRFCINAVVIIAFLAALFCAGLAIYAALFNISFSAAWSQLVQAIRGGAA